MYLRGRNFQPGTIRVYGSKLRAFAAYLAFMKQDPLSVDFRFLEAWRLHLLQEEKTPKTIQDGIYAVGSLYHYLKREGLVAANPAEDVDPVRLPETLPDWWTEDQVRRVLAGARCARDRAILETLYCSGGRASEVQAMDLARLVLGGPRGTGHAIVMGKGQREGVLHLMPEAVLAIQAWLPERAQVLRKTTREHETALFVSSLGKRLSYCPFRNVVVKAAAAAGVTGPAHPHMLRHSMATHNLNRGANLREVQEMLRHGSIRSTERYTHIAQDQLRDVMLKLRGKP